MTQRVIALFHNPWPDDVVDRPRGLNPIAFYRYAVWYKANPRTKDYMHRLQAEHFPDAVCVNTADPDWRKRIAEADKIILFYPDAIGLGFAPIERMIKDNKKIWAGITVFNGRHRKFLLNFGTLMSLRMRRFFEWTMLPEFLFLSIFIIVTPVLWALDLSRGRT